MKSIPEMMGLTIMVTRRFKCSYCVGGCIIETKEWRMPTYGVKKPPLQCAFHKECVNPKWVEE